MDFKNYTIGSLILNRGNYQDNHPEYKSVLKQISGRIYDLGYRHEKFKEIDQDIPRFQPMDRSDKPSKIDRYGKKYSWIAYYEMYGYLEANNLLRDYKSDHRISDISFDPSIAKPPKPYNIELPNIFGSKFTNFSDWMANGLTPNYKNILIQEQIRGEAGPWVLLDGYIQQSSQKDQREVFSFLKGLMIEEKNIDEFKDKFFSKDYPGNNSIPEAHKDYYTFAGEIPWSRQHAHYLTYKNGQRKRHIGIAFSESEFVPYKRPSKRPEALPLQERGNTFSFILSGNISAPGRWVRKRGVPVEIPVYGFSWESYHSVINDYSGYDVPAPAISSYLDLNYRNQSVELFDKNGERATIFIRMPDPESYHTTHLLYLRKDLLDRYLSHTGQTIVWAVWGERSMNHKVIENYFDIGHADKIYEEHKHIHRTFFRYSES